MGWPEQCAVVVPCLNEAERIGPLVKAIREFLPVVIVVDDGSIDGTAAAAESAEARVLRNARPCGKGRALRRGWQHALQSGFSWAVTMDGDGQHAPTEIPRFLEAAESTRARLVVGDRTLGSRSMPWLRRAVNRWMSRDLSRLAGQALPDSQCGFRLIDLKALNGLTLRCEHYEIESEVLVEFVRAGWRVQFVPIRVIYHGERSKIRVGIDTVRWLRWRLRASRAMAAAERIRDPAAT